MGGESSVTNKQQLNQSSFSYFQNLQGSEVKTPGSKMSDRMSYQQNSNQSPERFKPSPIMPKGDEGVDNQYGIQVNKYKRGNNQTLADKNQ